MLGRNSCSNTQSDTSSDTLSSYDDKHLKLADLILCFIIIRIKINESIKNRVKIGLKFEMTLTSLLKKTSIIVFLSYEPNWRYLPPLHSYTRSWLVLLINSLFLQSVFASTALHQGYRPIGLIKRSSHIQHVAYICGLSIKCKQIRGDAFVVMGKSTLKMSTDY